MLSGIEEIKVLGAYLLGAHIVFRNRFLCGFMFVYIYIYIIYICDHPWEKGVWVNFGQYEIIASVHSSGLNASIYVD